MKQNVRLDAPLRLAFHRHDYDGAYAKIVPFATSPKVVALQQERRAKAIADQRQSSIEGKVQKASSTLDIDLSTEAYLVNMLGDKLAEYPQQLAEEGWQAYQYNNATWYYNPNEQDIYAEHPVRREASIMVAAMSLRARHAARVMQRCIKRRLELQYFWSEWAEYVLPIVLEEVVDGVMDEVLRMHVEETLWPIILANVVDSVMADATQMYVEEALHAEELKAQTEQTVAELSEEQKKWIHRREEVQLATPPNAETTFWDKQEEEEEEEPKVPKVPEQQERLEYLEKFLRLKSGTSDGQRSQ